MGLTIEKFGVDMPVNSTSFRLEKELEPITEKMNKTPLRVNDDTWLKQLEEAENEFFPLKTKAKGLAGNQEFRLNSSKDCQEEFITKRKLTPIRSGAKGPSVNKETLTYWALSKNDELAKVVLEGRGKLSILSQLNKWEPYAKQGEVQCNWDQYGTPHGRYSCKDPNLQNRVDRIRATIEPGVEGWQFLSVDLGQAEYVVWASLAEDEVMLEDLQDDLHDRTGQIIEEWVLDYKMENRRETGKMVNFARLYMMKPVTLAQRLGCDVEIAKRVMEAIGCKYKKATAYADRIKQECVMIRGSQTRFGRKREIPALGKPESNYEFNEALKTAWHHHNAGTAAEVMKIMQLRACKALERDIAISPHVDLGLQMYDELIFQLDPRVVNEVTDTVLAACHKPIAGIQPFKITSKVGWNWLETQD